MLNVNREIAGIMKIRDLSVGDWFSHKDEIYVRLDWDAEYIQALHIASKTIYYFSPRTTVIYFEWDCIYIDC